MVSEIINIFNFSQNSRWRPEYGKTIEPTGSKVHSKFLYLQQFLKSLTFFISTKNPRWQSDFGKVKLFRRIISRAYSSTQRVQNLLEISLSLKIIDIFYFHQKTKMVVRLWKSKHILDALHAGSIVQKGKKIARNRSIFKNFEIIDILNFWQNSRWQPQFRKSKNFQTHYIQSLQNPKFA